MPRARPDDDERLHAKRVADEDTPPTDTDLPALGSAGCGLDQSGVRVDLNVAGESRSFKLSTPDDYDANTAYPLMFAWHGLGGNGSYARSIFGFQANAHTEAIVVYPDALPLELFGGVPGWDLAEDGYDLAYFDALYTHLTDHLCVDTDQVFSTGHSFGGYMSNTLGCYRSDVLNAIAPVARAASCARQLR